MNALDGQIEGVDGALQPLQEVDAHKLLDAAFPALQGQVDALAVEVGVFTQAAGEDEVGGRVDIEIQRHELLEDFVVGDGAVRAIEIGVLGQAGAEGDGFQPLREAPDLLRAVIPLDVLAGAGDGHAVQHLKKVKVQIAKKGIRGALLRVQLAPGGEACLGLLEDGVDAPAGIELVVDEVGVALVGKGELVSQVVEAVVDRRC